MFAKRAYLLDVTDRVPNRRLWEELVDVLAGYRYNEFFLFAEKDFPTEDFDRGRLRAYCEIQGLAYRELTRAEYEELFIRAEYAIVSTEAERSLAGRVEDLREEMIRVEVAGRARKASGFLVTDFSDGYAWQPPIVSLPGIVMGGTFASSGPKSSLMDLERELDRLLGAPISGLLLRLGTLYLCGGAPHAHESELFRLLAHDHGYSRHPGLTQGVLDEISGAARGVRIAAERWIERSPWAAEIVYAADLVDAACHRRNEGMLRALRESHARMWRSRYTDEGRVMSLAKLPRF